MTVAATESTLGDRILPAPDILRHVVALARHDRVMCSDGYDRALDYVAAHLGCPESWVKRIQIAADESFWGWSVPASIRHWKDGRPDPDMRIPTDRPLTVLEVRIPGARAAEILLVAHVCHPAPAANDNASGVAMCMELVRYYASHPPHFTLRFLFTAEYWGTVAFCARRESALPQVVAGISVDMVGADENVCGSTLVVDEIPDHLASCLDLILWDNVQTAARQARYRAIGNRLTGHRCDFQYYTAGSDHYILNDGSVGIPSTAIGADRDRFNHTLDDTPDKLSPDALNLCFTALVAALEQFSDPTDGGVDRRARLILQRYSDATHLALRHAEVEQLPVEERAFRAIHTYRHAAARLRSLAESHPTAQVAVWSGLLVEQFEHLKKVFGVRAGYDDAAATMQPGLRVRKTFKGPLYRNALYARLTPAETARIAGWLEQDALFFHKLDAALNYGERFSLTEIDWLLRLHYGGEHCQSRLTWTVELLTRHGLAQTV